MSESKIVYVNEDDGSDNEDENLIYGAAPKHQETDQPIEQVITPVKPEAQEPEPEPEPEQPEAQEPEQPEAQEPEPESKPVESKPETQPTDESEGKDEDEDEDGTNVEEDGEEGGEGEEEGEGSMFGGDGYRSEPDDASSVSSLDTDAILNVDPLYFRLTKFLQTGGEDPENVAEILKKINTNLELMNQNLMNLMNTKSSQ